MKIRIKINNGREDIVIENPIQLRLPGEGENVLFRFYFPEKYPSEEDDMMIFKNLANDELLKITADDLGNLESVNSTFAGLKVQEIELPQSVSIIEETSFSDCTNLNDIILPSSLIKIGDNAFYNCTSLRNSNGSALVRLPNSVTHIGNYAFQNCHNLPLKVLSSDLKTIGDYAFSGCSSLAVTELPPLLEKIGTGAFQSTNIQISEIPDSVFSIGSNAFNQSSVSVKTVPKMIKRLESQVFSGCNNITEFTIPETVVTVLEGVLQSCQNLERATIKPALASIPSYTFSSNRKLKTVSINSENLQTISQNAFSGCYELENFDFPNNDKLVTISSYAFQSCYKIKFNGKTTLDIPKRLGSISNSAFSNCDAITSVRIPDTISMSSNAFSSCDSLESVEFFPGTYSTNDNGSLRFFTSLNSSLFSSCTSLKNVTIPERITSISNSVFYNTGIRNLLLNCKVTNLTSSVLSQIQNLHSLFLPSTLNTINTSAFMSSFSDSNGDTNREISFFSVSPPKILGKNIFRSDGNLPVDFAIYIPAESEDEYKEAVIWENWASSMIPDKLPWFKKYFSDNNGHEWKIERFADYNTNLTYKIYRCDKGYSITPKSFSRTNGQIIFRDTIDGQEELITFSAILDKSNKTYSYQLSFAGGVLTLTDTTNRSNLSVVDWESRTSEYIENEEFFSSSLREIKMPSTTKSIGTRAFYSCQSLQTAVMPDSVLEISDFAFSQCHNLNITSLPASLKKIGDFAFYNCDKAVLENLPESVEEIGRGAFREAGGIKLTKLPASIRRIKDYTFYNCSNLQIENLPEGIEEIGEYAFYNCNAFKLTKVPNSLKSVGSYAFAGCSGVESISLPKTWTKIPAGLFRDCSNLDFSEVPTWIEEVGSYAFYNCRSLKNISFGSKWRKIEPYTFYNCQSLELTSFPEDMEEPGNYAFYNCRFISPKRIPLSWKQIQAYTFYACTGITDMAFHNGISTLYDNSFYNCTNMIADIPASITYFGNSCLYNCSKVNFPNGISPETTFIGNSAFSGTSITEVTIPDSLTSSPGSSAFSSCSKLKRVSFNEKDYSTLYDSIFRDNPELEEVNFAPLVQFTSIGSYAFYNCPKLTSKVPIARTATQISDYAFGNSPNVRFGDNDVLTLGEGESLSIGYNAFAENNTLKELRINNSNSVYFAQYAFKNCKKLESVKFVDNMTASIGQGCFAGCSSLKNITNLPGSALGIPYLLEGTSVECALSNYGIGSRSLASVKDLREVHIGSGSIGSQAFLDSFGEVDEASGAVERELFISSFEPPVLSSTNLFRNDSSLPVNLSIWVPYWSKEKYLNATTWNSWSTRFKYDRLPFVRLASTFLYNGENVRLYFEKYLDQETPLKFIIRTNEREIIGESVSFSHENGTISFDANLFGENGRWGFTFNYVDNFQRVTLTSPRGVIYTSIKPEFLYEIEEQVAGYGFTLRSDGYYESQNFRIPNSFALCKINFSIGNVEKIVLDCINYTESCCDYGIISNIDQILSSSTSDNSYTYFKSFNGQSSSSPVTVEIPCTQGDHFIMIKYRKDGSVDNGYDSFRFKIRDDLMI